MAQFSRWVVVTSALSAVLLSTSASSAWAQKGGSGGGGGGGGGGGSSTNPLKGVNTYTVPVAGTDLSPVATGVATLAFNSLGTYRSLDFQIGDVDLPDGSVLTVTFYDDSKLVTVGYYSTIYFPQVCGSMTVRKGSASLTLANGNVNTPQFGKTGFIQVTTTDAFGATYLIAQGTYAALGGP